jgi:hypothetical protein
MSACGCAWRVARLPEGRKGLGESAISAAGFSAGGFSVGSSAGDVSVSGSESLSTDPMLLPSLVAVDPDTDESSDVVLAVVDRAGDPVTECPGSGPEAPDEPDEDSEGADELVDTPDGSDDESGVSAQATCWLHATAAPIPRATASPPTRPTYAAEFVIVPSHSSRNNIHWCPRTDRALAQIIESVWADADEFTAEKPCELAKSAQNFRGMTLPP